MQAERQASGALYDQHHRTCVGGVESGERGGSATTDAGCSNFCHRVSLLPKFYYRVSLMKGGGPTCYVHDVGSLLHHLAVDVCAREQCHAHHHRDGVNRGPRRQHQQEVADAPQRHGIQHLTGADGAVTAW